ncbi:hypothetical protein [Actinosynnema pretiosum]|uniref:Uncharacterized protein n=1 Tax=Actinosynnema pretiosum TaxID=42197 RepID=A0A290Z7V3_9PSEU|nr:hypothetical protein [Actinosynnema pretiosum]ATE55100.1 hypothetical protein CNX65_18905 [Actinosynnema pretiosum]
MSAAPAASEPGPAVVLAWLVVLPLLIGVVGVQLGDATGLLWVKSALAPLASSAVAPVLIRRAGLFDDLRR